MTAGRDIDELVAAALADAGVDPDAAEELTPALEAIVNVQSARLVASMIGKLGDSPMAIAIERRLLADATPLRRAARQSGIARTSLQRAESLLDQWLRNGVGHPSATLPQ